MHNTIANSDEFKHFHNPIPNAKIAKPLEITAFLRSNFRQNMPILVFFFHDFCEVDTPYFFKHFQNSFFFILVPPRCTGVGGMGCNPPMAKAIGEWPSA